MANYFFIINLWQYYLFLLKHKRIIFAIIIMMAVISMCPSVVESAPSEAEIKSLEPNEEYIATLFDDDLNDVVARAPEGLDNNDIISVFPKLEFGLGATVKIWRAPRYTIIDGNNETDIASWGLSPREVVSDANIEVGEQDNISPGLDESISGVHKIQITRVKETEQKVTEIIAYETIEKNDATLEKGKTEIYRTGKNGTREKTYLIRREDGVEVSRTLINNEVIDEVQNKIVLIGTKIVVLSSESGEASWTWGVTASRKYSRGTLIRVTNLSNGKSVETRVGGYGPMTYTGRILDLNIDAWEQISNGGAGSGIMQVKVEELNE